MATYQNVNDYEAAKARKKARIAERAVGEKTARLLQASFRNFIGAAELVGKTGDLMKSTVEAKGRYNGLDYLKITSPQYGFMLNYGFEGVKSNGISMKLTATNHLADAIDKSRVLEILGDELTAIKGEEVMATLNFKTHG